MDISSLESCTPSMLDWNLHRELIAAGVEKLGKLSPDTVCGYRALGAARSKTGHLEAKTRELIAIAVAISLRCDGCVTSHVDVEINFGATRAEIAEAMGVAVAIKAGAAIFDGTCTLKAFGTHPDG